MKNNYKYFFLEEIDLDEEDLDGENKKAKKTGIEDEFGEYDDEDEEKPEVGETL